MHIADVHLGIMPEREQSWSEARGREIYDTFYDILEVAVEQGVDLLLIAGDLFHFPPTEGMLRELDQRLAACQGLWTVLIAGNHDYLAKDCPLETHEFISHTICLGRDMDTVYIEDLDVSVTGMSYGSRENRQYSLDHLVPDGEGFCQILLGHGGDELHCPYHENKLVNSLFDYIALGHIHKPQVIKENRMINVGSLEPINRGETGEHGYVLGEITPSAYGARVRARWIPFAKRQYIDLEIELEEGITNYALVQRIEEEIIARGKQHIYTVHLTGVKNQELHVELQGLVNRYYIVQVVDETRAAYDLEGIYQEHIGDLLGEYIRQYGKMNGELEEMSLEYAVQALMNS